MEIKVAKIDHQYVEVFDPNDVSLGMVNEYELNDLRIQIGIKRAVGYYVMFEGEKLTISELGQLNNQPRGFFDLTFIQHGQLWMIRKDDYEQKNNIK